MTNCVDILKMTVIPFQTRPQQPKNHNFRFCCCTFAITHLIIRIVRTELKSGKAPGIDNVYNIILKKAIGTAFDKILARAFTISLKLRFIPHVWKVAILCMLIKPDKPPSQTTSYRPIGLLSSIMKLFERVIEKRLRKHLEDNGFFCKYQSGNTSQQMTIFSVSLRPSWKASIRANM